MSVEKASVFLEEKFAIVMEGPQRKEVRIRYLQGTPDITVCISNAFVTNFWEEVRMSLLMVPHTTEHLPLRR